MIKKRTRHQHEEYQNEWGCGSAATIFWYHTQSKLSTIKITIVYIIKVTLNHKRLLGSCVWIKSLLSSSKEESNVPTGIYLARTELQFSPQQIKQSYPVTDNSGSEYIETKTRWTQYRRGLLQSDARDLQVVGLLASTSASEIQSRQKFGTFFESMKNRSFSFLIQLF